MKKLLIILLLCASAFAQSTAFKKQTKFRKQTWFAGTAASGGIAFRQACTILNQQTSVGSWTMSCGTTTAGDAIVIGILGSTTVTGLTCTGTNTYAFNVGSVTTSGFCLATNIAGGAETVTVTFPSSQYSVAIGLEFSGVLASSAIDGLTNNNQTQSSATSWSCPITGTLAATNELVICFGGSVSGATSQTFTPGGSFTIPASNGQTSVTNQNGFMEYYVDPTTTAITPTVTLGTAQTGATMTLVLKHT